MEERRRGGGGFSLHVPVTVNLLIDNVCRYMLP